ncbi:unnamed protein product [Moneuplotes crassus]|uniref:14 kDa phosphohistidine phosphatase n=1 Tax=Euplotes crassus TaxID=5936 RepID=A0AAD1Y7P5_EUPCR|nr:unnamed protein product [Moneuplotes crassus]
MDIFETVDIDTGTFKYIQVHVEKEGEEPVILIRGYTDCAYHADILSRFQMKEIYEKGLVEYESSCPGGGRIKHDEEAKTIEVYGYSQGFGKADHEVTTAKLKDKYPDYEITWSDEGY